MKVFPQVPSEELDSWGEARGFISWASEHRNIQSDIDKGLFSDFDKDRKKMFYFENDGWLKSYAADRLLSEMMNSEGIVYVEGNLHHFHKDYHIFIENPTPAKFDQAKRSLTSNIESGIRVFPRNVTEYWSEDILGEAKESKYFTCPFNTIGSYVWGHRKQENISGSQQRVVMDMHKSAYFFGGTDDRVFSYIALDIENRKLSGFTWISTYPDFEYGTLESGALSGEVSSSNVEQSLRVNRTIQVQIAENPSGSRVQTIRNDLFVTMDPVGWSFKETRFGDSDEYMLIDNVVSTATLGTGEEIVSIGGTYGFARGKVSVNWTSRSTTMDIQIGCQ